MFVTHPNTKNACHNAHDNRHKSRLTGSWFIQSHEPFCTSPRHDCTNKHHQSWEDLPFQKRLYIHCINNSFKPKPSNKIRVKNNNKMPPAINLPEKFVEPIFIATNSLLNILKDNSKLFSSIFTFIGFFFSSVNLLYSSNYP